jgi:hypothetical protein
MVILDDSELFKINFNQVCNRCKHYHLSGGDKHTCDAFPNGIPKKIWTGKTDHKKPYRGIMGYNSNRLKILNRPLVNYSLPSTRAEPGRSTGASEMTILQIRTEIEKIKKAVKPDPDIGVLVIYTGELEDQENHILPESIISINGRDASKMSEEEILSIIGNAQMRIFLPDNGRDPGF